MLALQVLNAVFAGISATFAVLVLFRPSLLSGSATPAPGEVLYSRMYAVRAIPLGLAAAIVPFLIQDVGTALLLFVAGAVQFADAFVLASRRELGRSVGALAASGLAIALGVVILVTALA